LGDAGGFRRQATASGVGRALGPAGARRRVAANRAGAGLLAHSPVRARAPRAVQFVCRTGARRGGARGSARGPSGERAKRAGAGGAGLARGRPLRPLHRWRALPDAAEPGGTHASGRLCFGTPAGADRAGSSGQRRKCAAGSLPRSCLPHAPLDRRGFAGGATGGVRARRVGGTAVAGRRVARALPGRSIGHGRHAEGRPPANGRGHRATAFGPGSGGLRDGGGPGRLRLRGTPAMLRANLSLRSAACRHDIRLAACVALGDAVGRGFDLHRSYWLPMTVAIVLKPDFASTFSRGVLRLAGTFAGLIFATPLFHLLPAAPAAQVAAIAALMFVLRCWGPANYGIFVTA